VMGGVTTKDTREHNGASKGVRIDGGWRAAPRSLKGLFTCRMLRGRRSVGVGNWLGVEDGAGSGSCQPVRTRTGLTRISTL